MKKTFFVAPTAEHSGLTSVSLGLVRALQTIGLKAGFFKPVSQEESGDDRSISFAKEIVRIAPPEPISIKDAQATMSRGDKGLLMENIVAKYLKIKDEYDIVVVEGLVANQNEPYTTRLNIDIASNLDSEVILVAQPKNMNAAELDRHIEIVTSLFSSPEDPDILGVILNKVGAPFEKIDSVHPTQHLLPENSAKGDIINYGATCKIFSQHFKLIGSVPWELSLLAPRIKDLARQLSLNVISEGEHNTRRVKHILVVSANVQDIIPKLIPGTLVVASGDRLDVILAASMAAISGVELAGVLLTNNYQPPVEFITLCKQAILTGLPVLSTAMDTYHCAHALSKLNREVQPDDLQRMESAMTLVSQSLDLKWLAGQCQVPRAKRLSPPAFRHLLSETARAAGKTIVLPEGNEPRTICAAVICHERNLAKCILIGNPEEVQSVATLQGVSLPPDLQIIDPDKVRESYVPAMVELRKNKGLTPQMALAMLEDNVVLATMMVALDEVDGLVSGAVHTTANTVRPALQLIKTNADAKVVSSVFFMCLPEQVVVYGDCAINPDPNAEELADIAIQSADSAAAFGIEPKVAMISYSTGTSGTGLDVDKVREATRLAKEKRPDLLIDGPLQYDAASTASVAKKKAPDSPVAGQATVFIFPDLNTGNTTYKAVQRSANVISVGPMLQGLRKPVNDLSRGALIEDIVFTIALTAVQAEQVANKTKQKG